MKVEIFLSCLLIAVCNANVEHPTITDSLLQAQRDLTHGQEFGEEFSVQNRQRLSNYLITIESQIIHYFLQGYESIKLEAIETRRIMNEDYAEPSFCKDRIRNRWELQVTRYGQKLSQCLGVADGYIKQFTNTLNELHVESRVYSNAIPNSSIHTLSQMMIFDARDNLGQYINDHYRDLLFRALARYDEFEEYVEGIYFDQAEYVRQLTTCFRSLPLAFQNESKQDLEAIRLCYGD